MRHATRFLTGRTLAGAVALTMSVAACGLPPGVRTVESKQPERTSADVGDSDDAVGSTRYDGTVEWTPCEGGSLLAPSLECGTVEVPLDHDDPAGDTIEIALARSPATGADRIGSLLFNPGGPGGSGIDFLRNVVVVMPRELQQRFDLVAFDPRGVGASTAVDCDVDFDDDVALLPAGDDEGWAALVDEANEQLARCTDETMRIAPYLGTNNAARDLDAIREALGDEQLSYVGFSYGTRLGATYAELFPERVRALVLDGAVKPTSDLTEIGRGQAAGFDDALERFAAACDDDPDCALRGSGRRTLDAFAELRARMVAGGELPAGAGRVLTVGELDLAVIAALYSQDLWPILAGGLADAIDDGDASILQAVADQYLGRQRDGTYSNLQAAGGLINCADDPSRPSVDEVRAAADDVAGASVWFADYLRASTGCLGVPDPIDPLVIGPADGSAPILVIGTTGDPATPYEWAVELTDLLASAVLFSVDAQGHTAFLSQPCVEEPVVRYLVDLELPAEGGCTGTSVDDAFAPAGESEIDAALALFDCLRDAGADIPDLDLADLLADPTGEEILGGIDPTDPALLDALMACASLLLGS